MLGGRPLFVLFGSSIVQYSFSNGGWGAALADIYARKVRCIISLRLCFFSSPPGSTSTSLSLSLSLSLILQPESEPNS
jgi:hypothetical protein